MKKLTNIKFWTLILTTVLAFGAIETLAQTKRKPVIRKKTATTPKPKPEIVPQTKLYQVDSGTRIRVRMNDNISSKTAKVGDTFETTVTEPIYSNAGVVVAPVGSIIKGRIDSVVPAAKGGKPGQIAVSFVSLKLPNGITRAINGSLTDLNEKDAKSDDESTASGDKMKNRKLIFIGGGATGGALIGAIAGGGKGAVIGGIVGAGAGLLGERLTKGEEAEVKSGTEFGVVLNQSFTMKKWTEPQN